MGTLVARVSAQYRCFRDIECMNLVWTDLGCETDHAFPCTGHADAVVILRERFHLQQPWRPPESLPLIAEDLHHLIQEAHTGLVALYFLVLVEKTWQVVGRLTTIVGRRCNHGPGREDEHCADPRTCRRCACGRGKRGI